MTNIIVWMIALSLVGIVSLVVVFAKLVGALL